LSHNYGARLLFLEWRRHEILPLSRYEHAAHGLRRRDLDPDPDQTILKLVHLRRSQSTEIRDVKRHDLRTAGRDGKPTVRIVLLKGFDQGRLRGFSRITKAKRAFAARSQSVRGARILLDRIGPTIRISGKAEKTSREESERYFRSRPIGSQLGAWASRQSEWSDRHLRSSAHPIRGVHSTTSPLARRAQAPSWLPIGRETKIDALRFFARSFFRFPADGICRFIRSIC